MKVLTSILFLVSSVLVNAQNLTIFDNQKQPLPHAHITFEDLISNDKTTVLTNKEGVASYPFDFDPAGKFSIKVSFIGFKPETKIVAAKQSLSFQLKEDEVYLNQVVITAQYSANNPEKAVHKIKIIDRKKIDAQAAVNLRDILQNENNIRLSQDNILGSSLSMQGISGQNVKILIDGVPVIGRLNGNIDLSQINLTNIERIELVEGPLSVNYGTDALAGTINLISKKHQKEKFIIDLNSYYETAGQYNLDGILGIKLGKNQLSISGGRNYFDGWKSTDPFIEFPQSKLADTNRTHQWKPKEQYFGKVQYNLNLKNHKLRPYLELFQEKITNRGFPRMPYYESAFDETYKTYRQLAGLDLAGKLSSDLNYSVVAAYSNFTRYKNTYFKDLTTLETTLKPNASEQDTSIFSLMMSRGSFSTSKSDALINYEFGYDINVESTTGKRIENINQEQGDYAIYTSAEFYFKNDLTIRPGLRYAYNTVYNAPLIPSINLKYKLKNYTLRASYAKGFRAPSLKELYFEFVDINHNIFGNDQLEAEQSNNFTANIGWQQVKGQSIKKASIGGYYNSIDNMISLEQEFGTTKFNYINIGKFKTLGTQLSGELAWEHWKVSAGAAYIGRYNQLVDSSKVESFSFYPEVRSSILYNFFEFDANCALFYKYNGRIPGYFTNDENEIYKAFVNDYHMLDITFTKNFWNKRVAWSIGGKNLLNVQNVQSIASSGAHSSNSGSTPVSWGRSIFTSLKLNLKK